MPQVLVLGAGAVGVSTALRLQQHGTSVVLIDRAGVGLETSYGNAGIIQHEAVEPYPMPRDLRSLTAIGLGTSNDVDYSLTAVLEQAGPLAGYWWNSAPARHQVISRAYATLIAQSTSAHAPLIEALGPQADGLVRREGYIAYSSVRRASKMNSPPRPNTFPAPMASPGAASAPASCNRPNQPCAAAASAGCTGSIPGASAIPAA